MAKDLCPNTTSDQTNYSAPVPFVGLYIAVATLVCFLLILCDVLHGFRRRKTWFPCRFFALNSFTLTLLGIAAKLPVDLTTSMPSAYDQLSKLIGIALLCVCMGFFMPSLGSSEPSECITNMAALTILVVTVVVNICIQMSTGIIFSFIPELVIIMYCMLVMLINLWLSSSGIMLTREEYMNNKEEIIKDGEGSMLERLKLCYLYCCHSEPQFQLCKRVHTMFASGHCFLCFVVVLEAIFRSLINHKLEFCNGLSDYGWSMRIIIFTQILVILLASIAIGFRWETGYHEFIGQLGRLSFSSSFHDIFVFNEYWFLVIPTHGLLRPSIGDYFRGYLKTTIVIGYIISAILCLPLVLVFLFIYLIGHRITSLCDDCFASEDSISGSIPKEHIDFLQKEYFINLAEWTRRKCAKEIKTWTSGSEKNNSSSHLGELLSKRPPHDQFYHSSCLDLVFLVRLVSVSTPSALNGHLVGCLNEVFDIIYFVDHTMNPSESEVRWRCKFAKAMWKGKDLKTVIAKESQSDVDHALKIIEETNNKLASRAWEKVQFVVRLINSHQYASIQELYDYMEQLFIDMLYGFLILLPHAILKEVVESHADQSEETVGRMLKLLCQIKHVEDKVQWSFPAGSDITRLITAEASVTNQHITFPVVHNDSSNVVASHVIEDEDHNVRNAHLHEIVEIE